MSTIDATTTTLRSPSAAARTRPVLAAVAVLLLAACQSSRSSAPVITSALDFGAVAPPAAQAVADVDESEADRVVALVPRR